jgi:hypothetical protein
MRSIARTIFLTFALAAMSCATAVAADRKEGEAEPAAVNGFRSAQFGMSEKDVRAAIKKDFGVEPTQESNLTQRTKALVVSGKELLKGTPPATVSYLLGTSTAKLIQVNIVWGAEPGGADVGHLVSVGNALRDYFLRRSYDPKTFATNQQLPNGGVVFFRGSDAKGSEIRVEMHPASRKIGDKDATIDKGVLKLSYAENPKNPDVFRIPEGSF